jgi:curli production assembly/transport component CsgG
MLIALSGCAALPSGTPPQPSSRPRAADVTSSRQDLMDIPPPAQPIIVAAYGVGDQTGQFKDTDSTQTLSRALSQGATSMLIQSLRDAGRGKWFTVVERENLGNLLKERQIVTEMRQRYLGERNIDATVLPSMLFAGVLIEGGVVGYDSNTRTGGAGARLLGIGGNVDYRQDTITVYLRAVATKTGEVLSSVVVRKMVLSTGLQSGAFRFISYKNLFEAEAGVTVNEPRTIALEQAVQKATHDLILDASVQGVWSMADKTAAAPVIQRFQEERGTNNGEESRVPPREALRNQRQARPVALATETSDARLLKSATIAAAPPRPVAMASKPTAASSFPAYSAPARDVAPGFQMLRPVGEGSPYTARAVQAHQVQAEQVGTLVPAVTAAEPSEWTLVAVRENISTDK